MSIGSFLKKVSGYDAIKKYLGKDQRAADAYNKTIWSREDNRIQRTVADARAAGIHPLFALGGATGGGSGSSAPPPSGNYVGNALKYIRTRGNDKTRATQSSLVDKSLIAQATANTRLSNARADEVEWQLNNSINKRAEGISNSEQDGPVNMEPVTRFHPVKGKPHLLPGEQPAWTTHRIYPDLAIRAPAQEVSEIFESVAMWPMIYEENYKAINKWIHSAQGRNWKALKKRHPAFKFMQWVAKKSRKIKKPNVIAYPLEVSA